MTHTTHFINAYIGQIMFYDEKKRSETGIDLRSGGYLHHWTTAAQTFGTFRHISISGMIRRRAQTSQVV